MIGAIAGDIIGSVYENHPIKTKDFPLFHARCQFTDDTVLTVAVADAILRDRPYVNSIRQVGRRYPSVGYGDLSSNGFTRTMPNPTTVGETALLCG